MDEKIEWWVDTVDCPYCEHRHVPTGSHEDDEGEWQCYNCEEFFDVTIDYSPSYNVEKK